MEHLLCAEHCVRPHWGKMVIIVLSLKVQPGDQRNNKLRKYTVQY